MIGKPTKAASVGVVLDETSRTGRASHAALAADTTRHDDPIAGNTDKAPSHDAAYDAPPSGGRDPVAVAALYCFAPLLDYQARRGRLIELAESSGVRGTVLLAAEGINGTIAGPKSAVDDVVAHIRAFPGFETLDVKWSSADAMPFVRLKVREKREIVTMGVAGIDPTTTVGTYVEPESWNDLISQPDVVVVDTRNDYEVDIGSFAGAVDPKTRTFREFPDWAAAQLDPKTTPKVAMFCTGGIRCEKATALLKSRGFSEVYHLKGGILRYLETVPQDHSLWRGECFVFDRRVSVTHGLRQGTYQLCSVCRNPIAAVSNELGYAPVDCPTCQETAAPERLARAEARRQQIHHAKRLGVAHIGSSQGKTSAAPSSSSSSSSSSAHAVSAQSSPDKSPSDEPPTETAE